MELYDTFTESTPVREMRSQTHTLIQLQSPGLRGSGGGPGPVPVPENETEHS